MTGRLILIAALLCSVISTQAFSFSKPPGHVLFEVGEYQSNVGESQNIGMATLVGDRFIANSNHNNTHAMFGIGYLFDGIERDRYGVDFGINAFYFQKARVTGTIFQEHRDPNLGYYYDVTNIPIYLATKSHIKLPQSDNVVVTLNAGIGPNIVKTQDYTDYNISSSIFTLPDHAFTGHTTTVFSAMAGVGLQFNILQHTSAELGYRVFYLGEGYLQPTNNQVLNKLETGHTLAHALVITVRV
jgi:opacity protein-like surface antigen